MNHIVVIGRLTKDPELRYAPSGVAVGNFTVAVDRPYVRDGNKETDFIPVVVWQKLAENCANHLRKGRLVAAEGRLQIRSYSNKDGQKRWATEIVASNVQFLDRGKDEQTEQLNDTDFGDINLDNLPF